jgi:hypothetical protein
VLECAQTKSQFSTALRLALTAQSVKDAPPAHHVCGMRYGSCEIIRHRYSKGGVQMSDSDVDTALWVGFPYAADNGYCPGCFTRLTSMTCSRCGLVLTDTRAPRLLALGPRDG